MHVLSSSRSMSALLERSQAPAWGAVTVRRAGPDLEIVCEGPHDLRAEVRGDAIVIRGRRERDVLYQAYGLALAAVSRSGFVRTSPLPVDVDPARTEVRRDGGTLRVRVPARTRGATRSARGWWSRLRDRVAGFFARRRP